MKNPFDIFLIIINPLSTALINLLVIIYQGLFFLHIPYSLGFSIILLTILIRFLLYPIMSSQLKTSKKMQELAPHLSGLKERHKKDAKKLQQETMKLYKEHGVNPAAGCLPMLLLFLVFPAMYQVLDKTKSGVAVSQINQIILDPFKLSQPWDQNFFGVNLGGTPANLISTVGPIIFLIPILTGLFQFIQSKMMMTKPVALQGQKEKKKADDFSSAFQTQSLYIFPVMIAFFGYSFPIGLSLFWNTSTVFGILQQYKIQGLGGLEEWRTEIEKRLKK